MNADGTVERTDDGRYVISFERRLLTRSTASGMRSLAPIG
jgi:hypothetical protein